MNAHIYQSDPREYNYPSYRRIPIRSIAAKQDELLKQPYVEDEEESTDTLDPSTLPIFNLVEVPDYTNSYRIDTSDIEKRIKELEKIVKENEETITKQHKKMKDNDCIIHQQIQAINTGALQIQENQAHITSQQQVYNHNALIVNGQVQQIYTVYADIASKQQILHNLQTQITSSEEKVKELEKQISDYTEQTNYHQNMIASFNMLCQDPEYFSKLMFNSMATNMIQNTPIISNQT